VVRPVEDAYISRFMNKGWRVNVIQAGVNHGQHYCYDHQHAGSPEASLRAARSLRDAVLRINNLKPVLFNGNGYHRKNKANKYGMPGVTLTCAYHGNGEPRTVSWTARWTQDGSHVCKSFAITKHGYAGAWNKAVAMRLKKTGQPLVSKLVPLPERWLKEWMNLRDIEY
jgi:hypothetical protein